MQNHISCCKSTVFMQFIKHLTDFFFQSRDFEISASDREELFCLDRLLRQSREIAPNTPVSSVRVAPHTPTPTLFTYSISAANTG